MSKAITTFSNTFSAINIKQEELKVDNSEQQQTSAIYNATCSQFNTQFNQFYDNNGHHTVAAASNQEDALGMQRQTAETDNAIPSTSTIQGFGNSTGVTPSGGIISATGEDFQINHQNLVDHKGRFIVCLFVTEVTRCHNGLRIRKLVQFPMPVVRQS